MHRTGRRYVVFTDIDTVWRSNPLTYLDKQSDVSILQVRAHIVHASNRCRLPPARSPSLRSAGHLGVVFAVLAR